jgi:PAS domain S-box-containing protein
MQGSSLIKKIDLLNHIQHGIIVIDTEGTILFWNSVSRDIFGYTLEEIEGKSLRVLHGGGDSSKFENLLEKCRVEEKYNGKWHAKCKDNTRIWLDVKSSTLFDEANEKQYCVITIHNIEFLETIKQELKNAAAIERTILENSADAIITTDEEGKILSFNHVAVQMFGYQKNEIIGEDIQVLIPSFYLKNQDFFLKRYKNKMKTITYDGDMDMQGMRKSGKVFYISMSLSNIPWKGKRMFVGIIRDLTQKRELEKRMIHIANEERRRIGRELHDGLGQMLTGIRLVAENLARRLKANEIPGAADVLEISEMIKEADEHARSISRGLVEINLEKMGLSTALENFAERILKTYGIECTYEEDGRVELENHTNALHIYRIVQEAVTNAVRHADAENIYIRLLRNGNHTAVIVEDNGSGFDPKDVTNDGSGIQIMKYRADIMGGVLDIKRTEDDKTQVRCIIPNNSDATELKE